MGVIIPLYTIEHPGGDFELGDMVMVTHVQATDLIRDLRERWTNLTGGQMKRYAKLLDDSLEEAQRLFRSKLVDKGYDGALAVRIAHPNITDGGAEIVIYGTGFRWKQATA